MKNFALVEIGHLTRTQRYRHHLLEELWKVATLTEGYYPRRTASASPELYVVVGSERGFCGDFNEAVLALRTDLQRAKPAAVFIVVGNALAAKLPASSVDQRLAGPVTADEIEPVLIELLRTIAAWQDANESATSISVIANTPSGVSVGAILPFEPPPMEGSRHRLPACNLPPEVFVRRFIDQYVDAKLRDVFASSLLSENHARLGHMTAAIARVDENLGELQRRARRERQSEITQEVETLLLAADFSQTRTMPRWPQTEEAFRADVDCPR